MGMSMPSWYDIPSLDPHHQHEDEKGLESTRKQVVEWIEKERASGIESIILGGFSQGGAVSLYTLTRSVGLNIAGVISLSGYLPLYYDLKDGHNLLTAVFMGHGTSDSVVPVKWGDISVDMLKKLDYQFIRMKKYNELDHGVCPEEINDVAHFIDTIVNK